jgi:hypothetical protein
VHHPDFFICHESGQSVKVHPGFYAPLSIYYQQLEHLQKVLFMAVRVLSKKKLVPALARHLIRCYISKKKSKESLPVTPEGRTTVR